MQVHDNYHTKNNNVYRNCQEKNFQNKNIFLSLNERHISKRFTLAASINAGYLTRCSVHWFFGGKLATTSKMSGSIISVSSSELAVSMFSKSEM